MKNKILIIIIILIISGCKGGGEQPKIDIDIYKGIDGLVVNFLPNAPPETIFEEGVLPIGVELYNKGAHDIENGYLSIILEKDYMSIGNDLEVFGQKQSFSNNNQIVFNLKGKSIFNPIGDNGVVTVSADIKKIDPQSETHSSDVLVSACYSYGTKLTQAVCIDDDIYNIKPAEKACTVSDISLEDQGAPVAIIKIETKILPDGDERIKPQFILYVENKGNGDVIEQNKIAEFCSSDTLIHEYWNKVLPSAMLVDTKLECKPAELKLKDKKGTIICTLEKGIEKKGTFKSPLEVTLDYGYMFTISKTTVIEKTLTY